MTALKIQSKNLLNMKMVANSFNFVFHIEVKTKSKYKILNFVFLFIKKTNFECVFQHQVTEKESKIQSLLD